MKGLLPKWIVFQLTKRCNLKCKMCYEWGQHGSYTKEDRKSDLDFKVIEKIIDSTSKGNPKYEFFGGEPLLYPGIFELIKQIRNSGCNIDFPTNGTLVEKYKKELIESGPNCIWISVDGAREINDQQRGTGVFNKVIKGIQSLNDLKTSLNKNFPKIGITYIITKHNHKHIANFFINEFNVDQIDFINIEFQRYLTIQEYNNYVARLKTDFNICEAVSAKGYIQKIDDFAKIDFQDVEDQLTVLKKFCKSKNVPLNITPGLKNAEDIQKYFSAKWDETSVWKKTCVLPWVHVEISANGDVTTCPTIYDMPLGNVYESNILDIWYGERIKNIRKSVKKNLFPVCYICCRHYQEPMKQIGFSYE